MMRNKALLLILTLALTFAALAGPLAEAGGTVPCPICTTYPDGSRCCVSCICDAATGRLLACTNHFCPPAGGGD